jgi:type IV secretory pathway VirJ component
MTSFASPVPLTERRRDLRILRRIWILLIPAALALGFLGYIGWFGGPTYTIVPATAGSTPKVAAVLLSGDMGFRIGMGPAVAERLAEHGIPVVGVNSLTYFREPRSVGDTASLIAGGIARAEALAPSGARIVLIGQSMGADMLQVGLSALPPADRRRVSLVALVVPSRVVRLQASPSELFPMTSAEFSGVPTALRLDWVPTLCVQGEDEKDGLCAFLTQANARRLNLPGGHPLHHDVDRVAAVLLSAIARTTQGKDRI